MHACVRRRWPNLNTSAPIPVVKSWRTPFAKSARDPNEADWLLTIADKYKPAVRAAFLRALEAVRGTVREAALRDALDTGSVDAVLRVLGLDKALPDALGPELTKPLEDAFIDAGRATPANTIPNAAQASIRFDLTNPEAVRFLRSYDMGLIRQVSDETRAAVKRVVVDAFTNAGGSPRNFAKDIRASIGLTDRQAQAVINYRSSLTEEDRPADQVERMVGRYQDKLIRLRAENIARTETLRAANAGQNAAWNAAADEGLLNRGSMRRQWLVTPDDRLCIYCMGVVALNPGGVPLGAPFITPLGPVDYAPLHPQCRCAVVLVAF